ncbi:MAG TPA: hypothetical protein VFU62_03765 [Hanamia sp.]|nr:hypothetical protein [Hanamia sp.]
MQNNLKKEGNNPDIFLLIKGLTSSEKSYYKKMGKRHADQNGSLHLKLFKLIDESAIINETELCNALEIKNKIHFSGLKAYLHKDILDTLVFHKRNVSVDTQLYFMQEQIKTLQEKKLLYLAQKLCKKAITLSMQYEKYHFLILLHHLQNKVLEYKDYKQFKDSTDSIFLTLKNAIDLHQVYVENRFLYEKVRLLTYRSWLPITTEELEEIEKAKILLNKMKPANEKQPLISLFHLNTLALCQYMLHENESCTNTCSRIYNLWNNNTHLVNEYPLLFLNSINTTCYNDFLCNNIPNAEENILTYGKIAKAYLKNEIYFKHFEVIQFNTQLKVYLKTAQFEQVKLLINKKAGTIFNYSAEILSPAEQLSIKGSVCISYFVLEHWDEAESLLSVIKEQNQHINREDILYFSLLFFPVILYEKKEWDRLDSALKSAYHFLYARKKLRPFERELMLFLGHLSAAESKRNSNQLINNFLERMNDYRNDPDRNLYFLYFNYYGWLESKLMNLRYMDYLKNRLKPLEGTGEMLVKSSK